METVTKRCMVCGKVVELRGGICDPCQERIRHEALGERENLRAQSDKELKKQGVTPRQDKH
jgi:hypothetical protein